MAKNKNFTLDTKLKIVEDYKKVKSAEKIAPKYNISANSIRRILHQHDVEVKGGNNKRDHLIEKAIEEYTNGELLNVVLTKYGFHKRYLKKILNDRSIKIIDLPKSIIQTKEHLNLYNNYELALKIYEKNKKIKDVLDAFGLKHPTSFHSVMRLRNIIIPKKNDNTKKLRKNIKNIKNIINEYKKNIPITKLSKKYGTSHYFIERLLRENGVIIRNKQEANLIKNTDENFHRYCITRSYRSKPYILPSGKEIKVQGYEDDFLNYVFTNKLLKESDFDFKPPAITYCEKPKKKYYPDFYIPKYNLLIEIKSSYTLLKTDSRKRKNAEKTYNYIIIVDKKYENFIAFLEKLKTYDLF